MVKIDIQSDIGKLEDQLEHLGASNKYVLIDMLRVIGRGALREVKIGYKRYLRINTWYLYRSYIATLNRGKGFTLIHSPMKQYVANAYESGKLIKAKRYKYMTYNIGGKWFKSREVQLPHAPFFSEGTEAYVSSKMQADIDKLMKKNIDRFNSGNL